VQNLLFSSLLSKNVKIKIYRTVHFSSCFVWTGQEGSGEDYIKRTSRSVQLTKYFSVDEINNNEMGGSCGTYEGEEKCI